jgi:hypothetical protein
MLVSVPVVVNQPKVPLALLLKPDVLTALALLVGKKKKKGNMTVSFMTFREMV